MLTSLSRFVDFGSLPCFTGIWEFATTQARRDVLQNAYTQFVSTYTADLGFPGPYVQVRMYLDDDFSSHPGMILADPTGNFITMDFPPSRLFIQRSFVWPIDYSIL
jgi:hypothetical protein